MRPSQSFPEPTEPMEKHQTGENLPRWNRFKIDDDRARVEHDNRFGVRETDGLFGTCRGNPTWLIRDANKQKRGLFLNLVSAIG